MRSSYRRLLLPGVVFQSLCIAGGYGTGRELATFFLSYGPAGGLLGLVPATLLVSLSCMVAFELARAGRTYDYRSFLAALLGPAWVVYEAAYLVTLVLVLAVVAAAADALVSESAGAPAMTGTLVLLALVGLLAFKGTRLIEDVMSAWSAVLYAVYLLVCVRSLQAFGPQIGAAVAAHPVEPGWLLSGLRYAALQLALVPAVLFATTHFTARRDAVIAGALAGPILMAPALLFMLAMLAHYPGIVDRPVPANPILEALDSAVLRVAFPLVLVGTFVETGTGLVHAFNERLATRLADGGRALPVWARPATALSLGGLALALSRWGLIDLIAVGYGAMTWVFIGVFVVPLLTLGAWRVVARPGSGL